MLSIFVVGIMVFAALAIEQSAIETASLECIQSSQIIADELAPYAEAVAGQQLKIAVVAGTPQVLSRLVEERGGSRLVAQINDRKEIVVFPIFCGGPHGFKEEMVAHEIGHLVDIAVNGSPFWSSWQYAFDEWETRPVEKKANEYARQIILLKRNSQ